MEPLEEDDREPNPQFVAPSTWDERQPEVDSDVPPQVDPVDLTGMAEELDRLSSELDAVEATLARLLTDPADTCEVCGAEIDLGHLRANPTATRCPGHSAHLQLRADFG